MALDPEAMRSKNTVLNHELQRIIPCPDKEQTEANYKIWFGMDEDEDSGRVPAAYHKV